MGLALRRPGRSQAARRRVRAGEVREEGRGIHDLLGHSDARLGDFALHKGAHGAARSVGGRVSLRATDERRASRSTVVDDVHAYREPRVLRRRVMQALSCQCATEVPTRRVAPTRTNAASSRPSHAGSTASLGQVRSKRASFADIAPDRRTGTNARLANARAGRFTLRRTSRTASLAPAGNSRTMPTGRIAPREQQRRLDHVRSAECVSEHTNHNARDARNDPRHERLSTDAGGGPAPGFLHDQPSSGDAHPSPAGAWPSAGMRASPRARSSPTPSATTKHQLRGTARPRSRSIATLSSRLRTFLAPPEVKGSRRAMNQLRLASPQWNVDVNLRRPDMG